MDKKKLKIAVLSAFSGEVSRGAETFVHELSNNLVKLGDSVSVYQNGKKLSGSQYKTMCLQQNGVLPPTSSIPFLSSRAIFILRFTVRALSKLDNDTQVVIPTNGQWQSVLTKIWCLWHNKKMVISGQSGPGLDDRINIMCFPDSFVALSTTALQKAKADNRFVHSTVIPNGVDTIKFSPNKTKIKLQISTPIVLCVSAFIKQKQIHLVINAISKLQKVSLLLVGTGPLKETLVKECELKLKNRYQILQLPYEEMPEVYRTADVFTLVSASSEAFGIVYAEALASNLPVVARDDEARRQIVGDAGLYVKHPENASEYASVIKAALDKNWKSIPRNQSLQFDWSQIADQYQALFLRLVL